MGDAESPLEGFDLRNDTPIRRCCTGILGPKVAGPCVAALEVEKPFREAFP